MVTGIAVVLVAVAVTANDVVVAVLSTNNARSLRRWQWQQQDGVSLCQQTARSRSKSFGGSNSCGKSNSFGSTTTSTTSNSCLSQNDHCSVCILIHTSMPNVGHPHWSLAALILSGNECSVLSLHFPQWHS